MPLTPTGPELLEDYVRNKRPLMCRWARKILSRQEDIDDCVQIACTRASQSIHQFNPALGAFHSWLCKVIIRTAMHYECSCRSNEVLMGLIVLEASPDGARDVEEEVCENAEQEELLARAQRVLCMLPPDVQHALWKASRGEMSMEQVGRLMDCTPNAAAVRLYRVRRTVKGVMS